MIKLIGLINVITGLLILFWAYIHESWLLHTFAFALTVSGLILLAIYLGDENLHKKNSEQLLQKR